MSFAMGIPFLALLWIAGLALAALDPQKRAAHDRLIGSRVVYRLGSHKLAVLPAGEAAGRSSRSSL
jgi:hypothetical protein